MPRGRRKSKKPATSEAKAPSTAAVKPKKPALVWRKKQVDPVINEEDTSPSVGSDYASDESFIESSISSDEKTENDSFDDGDPSTDDDDSADGNPALDLFEAATISLMVLEEEGVVRTSYLKEDIADIMKINAKQIQIDRVANGAFRIALSDIAIGIGLRRKAIEAVTTHSSQVFVNEIERLIEGKKNKKKKKKSDKETFITMRKGRKDKGKPYQQVQALFRCLDCGRRWNSFNAYIDRKTGRPWQGKSQYCAMCGDLGEMISHHEIPPISRKRITRNNEQTMGHRVDLNEWSVNYNIESRRETFILPSTIKRRLEQPQGMEDLTHQYECQIYREMNDGFLIDVFALHGETALHMVNYSEPVAQIKVVLCIEEIEV